MEVPDLIRRGIVEEVRLNRVKYHGSRFGCRSDSQATAPIELLGLELGNSLRREAGGGGPEAEDETRFLVVKRKQARD
jgi:hypothetical protein